MGSTCSCPSHVVPIDLQPVTRTLRHIRQDPIPCLCHFIRHCDLAGCKWIFRWLSWEEIVAIDTCQMELRNSANTGCHLIGFNNCLLHEGRNTVDLPLHLLLTRSQSGQHDRKYYKIFKLFLKYGDNSNSKISCSQPIAQAPNTPGDGSSSTVDDLAHGISFSQPVHINDMFLSSQLQCTPGASQTLMQRLVKCMTRFFTKVDAEETLKTLRRCIEKLGYTWKKTTPRQVTVTTVDKRLRQLVLKATLLEMDSKIIVDFRLSKGDGLEFKRQFVKIKAKMTSVITKGPLLFPTPTPTIKTLQWGLSVGKTLTMKWT